MKYFLLVSIGSLLFSLALSAAVPNRIPVNKNLIQKHRLQNKNNFKQSIITALKLPLENRMQALRRQKKSAPETLQAIVLDESMSLQLRWRAITAFAMLDPENAENFLISMFERKEWFLRNSALVGIGFGRRKVAIYWATKLLNDPALVVRTAAVQVLEKVRGIEAEKELWKKLYSKENYRKGKSLWIRKHIARALSKFAIRGQEAKFTVLLRDPDKRIHPFAMAALEKATGQKIADGKNIATRRDQWLAWASSKGI